MPARLTDVLWLLVVGALWGCTNPLLKSGAEDVTSDTHTKQQQQRTSGVLHVFVQLFTHWRVCSTQTHKAQPKPTPSHTLTRVSSTRCRMR